MDLPAGSWSPTATQTQSCVVLRCTRTLRVRICSTAVGFVNGYSYFKKLGIMKVNKEFVDLVLNKWKAVTVQTYRGFVANATLHHVLVDLPLHGDQALTHPAADYRSTAALRGGEGGVGRRVLPEEHRRLSRAGERGEACTGREARKGENGECNSCPTVTNEWIVEGTQLQKLHNWMPKFSWQVTPYFVVNDIIRFNSRWT